MFAIFSSTFLTNKIGSYHVHVRNIVGKICQKIIRLKISSFNEVNKFDISTKAFSMHISYKMYSIFKQRVHCNQIIDPEENTAIYDDTLNIINNSVLSVFFTTDCLSVIYKYAQM